MKVKIQIKSRFFVDKILFELETENNTIKDTLIEACKQGANLQGANLQGANLQGAKDADYAIALTRILPEGDIIGYKKCQDDKIVKLLIPKEAKRSHAFGRKCRAEYAVVLEITKGTRKLKSAVSQYNGAFKYKVGEIIKPDKFDENWKDECSSGIHFFITKVEAGRY